MIHVDTHILLWLADGAVDALTPYARARIDGGMVMSPMVRVELTLLSEVGRLERSPADILENVMSSFELEESALGFAEVGHAATRLGWTRDPFDRLITATAVAADADLLTKDRVIRHNFTRAVWQRPAEDAG